MIVYLAQAIDMAKGDRGIFSRFLESLIDHIREHYNTYDPTRAFGLRSQKRTLQDSWFIRRTNEAALNLADVVVMVYDGSPSWGLPLELARCHKQNKLVVFVVPESIVVKSIYLQTLLDFGGARVVTIPDDETVLHYSSVEDIVDGALQEVERECRDATAVYGIISDNDAPEVD